MDMEPRDLLRALMAQRDDNPNSLATKLKGRVTQPQIHKYLTGTSKEPRRSTLQPLAEYFDVPIEAFYSSVIATETAKRLRLGEPIGGIRVSEARSPYTAGADVDTDLIIREYDTGGGMGKGLVLRDQPGMIHSWRVTPEWVQKNVHNFTSARNLAIVTGFGDSMRPLYNPGDPLLVDRGVTAVEFDAIYFFRVEDEGFVKRLQRIPGVGLRAISENKSYESWDIRDGMDFEVFARVIKVWRGEDF